MDRKNLFELMTDYSQNSLKAGITKNQAKKTIMDGLIEMNGGSSKIDLKSFRRHPEMFDLIEEVVTNKVASGLKGNEFFMNFVEEKNLAEGDAPQYDVKKDSNLVVANIARGTKSVRRQRLGKEETFTVNPTVHSVKVYDELTRILTNRADINDLSDEVIKSIIKQRLDDIYLAWFGVSKASLGANYYPAAGAYNEDGLMDLCNKVSAANDNAKVLIIATLKGARTIGATASSNASDEAKSDMYNQGYPAKWNGIDVMVVPQRYKSGTETFMFDDNIITVVPVDMDKPIKQTIGGSDYMYIGSPEDNADSTIDILYLSAWGTGVVVGKKFGKYEIEK